MSGTEIYVTELGEQTSFTLDDGSVVHLNTQSRLRISFTDRQRDVELLSGEALFQVAHDEDRPFRVVTDDTVVEAIGTRFNVYRDIGQTMVTVVEGKVAVSRKSSSSVPASAGTPPGGSASASPVLLVAGDRVAVNASGAILQQPISDTEEITAWRERRLVFRNDSLAMIAAQFNRYNRVRIEVSGSAADRLLTGVFDADDPESMVEFLVGEPSIRVTREPDRIIIGDR